LMGSINSFGILTIPEAPILSPAINLKYIYCNQCASFGVSTILVDSSGSSMGAIDRLF
jgi:hypothetical protein